MKIVHRFMLLTISVVLCGCFPIAARYSFDSETDFSGLKSYSWGSMEQETFSTAESTAHFIKAMNNALAEKGFVLDVENPDFIIITARVETYKEGYMTLNGNVNFPKAVIRVNFNDTSTNEGIYEAAADAYVSETADQDSKNALVDKAANVLLQEFPPGDR
jgi:hypothetical protein